MSALLLGGCSSDEAPPPDPTGIDPTGTATASPETTPSSEPTPTDAAAGSGVVDLSDEATGIFFEDLPEVSGDQADVLNAYMAFETEIWHTDRTVSMSDTAINVVAESAVDRFYKRISLLAGAQAHLGGQITFTSIQLESTDGLTAAVTACADQSQIDAVYPDRTVPVTEDGGSMSYRSHVLLSRESGAWLVTTSSVEVLECS